MFKGLWFPEPLKWVASYIFDEFIYGVENFLVLFLPLNVVFPRYTSPSDLHAAAESWLNEFMLSKFAFVGLSDRTH
jgi:hypothetical protein